jgi:hypothetical protein
MYFSKQKQQGNYHQPISYAGVSQSAPLCAVVSSDVTIYGTQNHWGGGGAIYQHEK